MEFETTYVPPRAISEMDDDVIHARMLMVIPDNIDKTKGGFAHDFTRPAALEKAEMLMVINEAIQIFFPEWSYGGYLDLIAKRAHLTRKSATYAEGYVDVTGVPGTEIPEGFIFSTPATASTSNIEYAVIELAVIDGSGAARAKVRCTQEGTIGNAAPGSVTLMATQISGVETVTNTEHITGGTEQESDDSLRTRIEEYDRSGSESYVGCDADYIRWAKEVDGVGTVRVVPEWMGKGTGTVKVIIMDANGNPANQSIIDAVYHHIISTEETREDDRLAPIGAILTVSTEEPVQISISATLLLEPGADIVEIEAAYREALHTYFNEAKQESCVRYTRIASVLSETVGVLDYSDLTLNGSISNIPITVNDFPTIGSLTLVDSAQPIVPDDGGDDPEEPTDEPTDDPTDDTLENEESTDTGEEVIPDGTES